MNISTRKRFLYSHFDKATAESAPDIPVVAGIESADPYGVLDEDDDMIAAMLAEEMSGA